jgi:3-oxoacyl-[acyl-carrier-protein] synthase III
MATASARRNLADRRRQPEDTDCAIVVTAADYPGDPRY